MSLQAKKEFLGSHNNKKALDIKFTIEALPAYAVTNNKLSFNNKM